MRSSLASAIVFLLLNSVPIFSQTRELQLTTRIVGQQRCAVSSSLDVVRLTLLLSYANGGREKLILYRGSRLFFQVFISRTGDEASARKNELRTTHARYFDEQPERILASVPGNVFVTLSPGASYEIRQVISVPVAPDVNSKFNVSIAEGSHVLHVTSSTWYESRKLAEDLRQRWRARGFLWTDPLASNPIAFSVDVHRSAGRCQETRASK